MLITESKLNNWPILVSTLNITYSHSCHCSQQKHIKFLLGLPFAPLFFIIAFLGMFQACCRYCLHEQVWAKVMLGKGNVRGSPYS